MHGKSGLIFPGTGALALIWLIAICAVAIGVVMIMRIAAECRRLSRKGACDAADEDDPELRWSERRDLNSRPPVPQTGALTGLRYAPPMGRKPMIYARAVGRARVEQRVGRRVETAISPQSTPRIRK